MTVVPSSYPRYSVGDFSPGLERRREFVVSEANLAGFTEASEDRHPLHVNDGFAAVRGHRGRVLHGMLVASRVSAFIAQEFIGSDGLLVAMTCDFRRPAYCDEKLQCSASVVRVTAEARVLELAWTVTDGGGAVVQRGTACAILPES